MHKNIFLQHEGSEAHLRALFDLKKRKSTTGVIDEKLKQQIQKEHDYWTSLLKRLISVIKYIAERGLAFRGDNETMVSPRNGNYLGMLEVIAQYDDFLSNHLQEHANRGRGHINYLSHHVVVEIIQIMGDTILKEMITRLKQSKYYSVSVDSTPDAAHVDQLTLVLRYMEGKDPVERFFAFMDNPGHCAKDMFIAMTDFLRSNNIEIADCRGQSYDNVSAMSGQYNGLQTLIKEENELAEWVPCSAHSLNLVLKDSADSCHAAVDFFYFVEKLFVFFSASTKRTELLNNSEAKQSLKRTSTTRWSCRADATKALIKDYKPLQIALEKLSTDTQEKGETCAEAMGLLRRMNTLEIA